jgi:hypothetical protein
MAVGEFNLPSEKAINAQFPDIKMLTVKDMFGMTWKAHAG